MDSSDKLEFLLGDLKLRAKKIDSRTWSKLVFDCINQCKPQLSFLPEQHPIGDFLNCSLSDYDKRITPKEVVAFPRGVSFETKCLEIVQLETEHIKNERGGAFGLTTVEPGWKYIIEKRLLLTCQGKLLKWVAKYQPQEIDGLGYRSHRSGMHYRAESCSFGTVTAEGLTALFAKNDQLAGHQILTALRLLVQKGIENRERNLLPMRRVEQHIAGILSRID